MRYWLVVGKSENWTTAFEHGNIWGLRPTQEDLWTSLQENDFVLFYATSPVKGVIGYGRVRTKFRQNKPLWPQEAREAKVIWPLRFEFDVVYCLPTDRWTTERVISDVLQPRGGFQLLSERTGEHLVSSLGPSIVTGQVGAVADGPLPVLQVPAATLPSHDQLKDILLQIGRLQNFIVESEYVFDIGRLDVVWRRVQQSVPTYVFEVQIGGNLYQALSKLKHAFDLWNSHVFLVCGEEDSGKALQLLSGTFHEIRERLRIVECRQLAELLRRKKSYRDLEKELGIL